MSKSSTLSIDEKVLSSFIPKKTFNYHQGASITSLDFDDSGQYLISAGIDKSIQLYDIYKGIHSKDIQSQKYGAHLAKFTHNDLNCLYITTPDPENQQEVDNSIRYLSLSDKKYLRYFKGHKAQVVSLAVDPVHDGFITSSVDGTVKIWDLKSSSPTGNLDIGQPALVAYDPHGIIFVVAKYPDVNLENSIGEVQFYDLKTVHKNPFLAVTVECSPGVQWTKIEFANNGKLLLIATDSAEHYIIDAFLGQLLTTLSMNIGPKKLVSKYPLNDTCCFSPCGRYVMAGSSTGTLLLFDLNNIKSSEGEGLVKSIENPKKLLPFKVIPTNQGVPKILAFNPKLLTIATADNSVTLWQPFS